MSFIDLIFPKHCAGCGKSGTYFCPNCIKNAKFFFPEICPICKKTSLDGLTHKNCAGKSAPDGLTVIWKYQGAPKNLVKKLKYKFAQSTALSFASAATGTLKNFKRTLPTSPNWQKDKFILVPVPLHWTRKNWRGFNHTEEIGKFLCQTMGWKTQNLLIRKKHTAPQVSLKREKRLKNLNSAFTLNPQFPNSLIAQSPNIILFDDVWTTGTTMLEATKVLKEAGFKKVWCLALCG